MNENDFDQTARTWLDDGPTRMSDRAVLSTLETIHATRQRRALWPAWRATPVRIFVSVASAAVLVIAVGLLAINVVPRQPDGSSVGGPSPSPSPSQAVDFPAMTSTFVSPTYGYSFKFRNRGGLEEATEIWDPANQPVYDRNFDVRFDGVETGEHAYFEGASTQTPDGVSIDGWVDEFVTPLAAGGCGAPRSQQAEITIDAQPARIAECPNQIEATVVAGGRLYLFTMSHERSDARAWFDAWIATIDLTPETAGLPPSGDGEATSSPSEAP